MPRSRTGHVHSIQVSTGGVPKTPVPTADVTVDGLSGDQQSDRKHHGGPERAVSVWSLDLIATLHASGHPVVAGSAGENVTVKGVDWSLVKPGARIAIGSAVLLEVTDYANPCKTIRDSFLDGQFTRISQKLHPGTSRVYAKVLAEGVMHVGDSVRVTPRV